MIPILKLNCLIYGQVIEDTFTITIRSGALVCDVKELIQEIKKPAYSHIDADALDLWTALESGIAIDSKDKLNEDITSEKNYLWPSKRLSEIFGDLPDPSLIHVVVAPPPKHGYLTLNCLIFGHPIKDIFEISVPHDGVFADVKKAIHKITALGYSRYVDVNRMMLRKVSGISVDSKCAIGEDIVSQPPWSSLKPISETFWDLPDSNQLHIVVAPPTTRMKLVCLVSNKLLTLQVDGTAYMSEVKERIFRLMRPELNLVSSDDLDLWKIHVHIDEEDGFENLQAVHLVNENFLDPSVSAFQAFPNGTKKVEEEKGYINIFATYPEMDNIPGALLHPVFGTFQNDYKSSVVPSEEDKALQKEILDSLWKPFEDEKGEWGHVRLFKEILKRHGFEAQIPDEDYLVNHHYPLLLVKERPDFSSKDPEKWFREPNSLLHSLKERAKSTGTYIPCFLLHLNYLWKPMLTFYAAKFSTGRPIMESMLSVSLVPDLGMGFRFQGDVKEEEEEKNFIARDFAALRKAIQSLQSYYEVELPALRAQDKAPSMDDPRFPYPRKYTSLDDLQERQFRYTWRINSFVYFGITDRDEEVCVKFSTKYSTDVHRFCASKGFAPALRGFETLPGGSFMIIMDRIGKEYEVMSDLDSLPGLELRDALVEKIGIMHQAGYVHGDVCNINIWVKKNSPSEFMLIDFDWSGLNGQVYYPSGVATSSEVKRPYGVRGGEPILSKHDLGMIDIMFSRVSK